MSALTAPQLLFLFNGLAWTVALSLLAFAGGGLLGFAVAIGRVYGPNITRQMVMLYIKLVQGTPLLVLLSLAYFGLPSLGLNVEPLTAAGLGLSIYVSAYLGEIWRGCIESVPRTQAEAAEFSPRIEGFIGMQLLDDAVFHRSSFDRRQPQFQLRALKQHEAGERES